MQHEKFRFCVPSQNDYRLLAIATLLTIAFIFGNSFNFSEQSYQKSNYVSSVVQNIVDPQQECDPYNFGAFIRKAAHAIEFFLLGCELAGLLLCYAHMHKANPLKQLTTPFFAILAIAVTDEYIQYFVQRTSSVKNIVIDFCGGFAGVFLPVALYNLVRFIAKQRSSE